MRISFGLIPSISSIVPAHNGAGAPLVRIDAVNVLIDTTDGWTGLVKTECTNIKKDGTFGERTTTISFNGHDLPESLRLEIELKYAEITAVPIHNIDWEA